MLSRRYTIVLADRTTGVVRRFTITLKPALIVVLTTVSLPILIGTGAALKARHDVATMFDKRRCQQRSRCRVISARHFSRIAQ